jgi:hypothetical protein
MTNLLEQAINSNDADHAARLIQEALGIQSDEVANYVFPKAWPGGREQRARIIGEWLQAEALKPGCKMPRWPEVPRQPVRFSLTLAARLGRKSPWMEPYENSSKNNRSFCGADDRCVARTFNECTG